MKEAICKFRQFAQKIIVNHDTCKHKLRQGYQIVYRKRILSKNFKFLRNAENIGSKCKRKPEFIRKRLVEIKFNSKFALNYLI